MTIQSPEGDVTTDGQTQPLQTLPTMFVTIETEIDGIDARHHIRATSSISDFKWETSYQGYGALRGMKSRAVVTDRALELERRADVSGKAAVRLAMEYIERTIRLLVIPLPEEPVGVGALWEADIPLNIDTGPGPLSLRQWTTYRLESIDGDILRIGVNVRQASPQPSESSPAAIQLETTGDGTETVDLRELLPAQAMFDLVARTATRDESRHHRQVTRVRTILEVQPPSR